MSEAALEAFLEWGPGTREPTIEFEVDYEPQLITISRACTML